MNNVHSSQRLRAITSSHAPRSRNNDMPSETISDACPDTTVCGESTIIIVCMCVSSLEFCSHIYPLLYLVHSFLLASVRVLTTLCVGVNRHMCRLTARYSMALLVQLSNAEVSLVVSAADRDKILIRYYFKKNLAFTIITFTIITSECKRGNKSMAKLR